MAWSYVGPSNSDKDKVRFLVGDNDYCNQLVSDDEIVWALTQGGVYQAASIIARSIAANFSRRADFEVAKDLKVAFSKTADNYNNLAKELALKSARASAIPYAGGISVSDKESYEADTDRVKPVFHRKDFMDYEDSATSLTADSGD